MRRALVAAVAVPVLLLAACGSEDGPEVSEAPAAEVTEDTEPTQDTEPTEEETTEAAEPTEEETTEAAEPTEEETTEAAEPTEEETTEEAGGGEAGSEEDGAAASAVVKEFFQAMFSDDPGQLCDLMVGLSGTGPMSASETDMQLCQETMVPVIEDTLGTVPGDPDQIAGILDLLEIAPARVEGDTARVGAEEFGELFGSGFGDGEVVLKKFDGQWYVDVTQSF